MKRWWMGAVMALAAATAASAQDFDGLSASQFTPAPPVVTQQMAPPAPDQKGMPSEAMPYDAPLTGTEQPAGAPGATYTTRRYHGSYGYRWYPGYARHDEWANAQWYNWNRGSYVTNEWWHRYYYPPYGTDHRWYYTHPYYRSYGWRDRRYPYAWSPDSSTICSW